MEEFVNDLNLPFEGEYKNNKYVVEVYNSNDWSRLFNSVNTNKLVHIDESFTSVATDKETVFLFTDGVYDVKLEGDYEKDYYKLTVEER